MSMPPLRSIVPVGLTGAILLSLTTIGLPLRAQQGGSAVTVLVTEAETRSLRPEFEHPGLIEAVETASLRPLVRGQLVERHVTPGDIVEAGELLFRIDDREYRFALMEAEASLQLAQAAERQRRVEFERARELVEREVGAQQRLDLAEAEYAAAQAQVAMAEARVARAEKAIEDTEVRAPFEGRISAANRAVGDLVQPGDPTQPEPLAEIVRLDPVYAISFVSQQIYNEFLRRRDRIEAQGQVAPELELTMILPGGEVYPETGSFVSWDFEAAGTRGSIAARASFPNPNGELLPGETVTIRGRVVEAMDRVMIPQRAVGQDQEGRFVMVVGPDNIVERRLVELGIRDGADWAVVDGLDEGERVIVEGLQKVRPGATVATEPFGG
jgi:RND family efflux transporter MFP subunit